MVLKSSQKDESQFWAEWVALGAWVHADTGNRTTAGKQPVVQIGWELTVRLSCLYLSSHLTAQMKPLCPASWRPGAGMAHFPHAGTSALGSPGFALCVTACTCVMCYTCARHSCGNHVGGQAWLVGLREAEKIWEKVAPLREEANRAAEKALWKLCFSLSASGAGY